MTYLFQKETAPWQSQVSDHTRAQSGDAAEVTLYVWRDTCTGGAQPL